MSEQSLTLLVFEAGLQSTREYWLQDLKSLGYKLILAQPWPLVWEGNYVDAYLQCKFNPWSLEERHKVAKFAKEHFVSGIICLNEGTVPFANDIIEDLGLPKLCMNDINTLRNKINMRNCLSSSTIGQPKFTVIRETDSLNSVNVDYPAVVKPAQMMASLGVILVKDKNEAISAIDAARQVDFDGEDLRHHYGFNRDTLIESYVPGDEYSIETLVQNGELLDFFITKKFKCAKPYFDEIGHLANPPISNELIPKIKSFLNELHSTLGILNAVTHTEVKISDLNIVLIEIGCRPGGDMIPKITSLSADFNLPETLAKISTGIIVERTWKAISDRKQVAVYFPHDVDGTHISKNEIKNILADSIISEFQFDEISQVSINVGLRTNRRGQIIFSATEQYETKLVLERLVAGTNGI